MKTNDEDLELFLEDFGRLLRKYNYNITPFSLSRVTNSNIIIGGFSALAGGGVLKTEFFTVTEEDRKFIEEKDNKNEN